MYYERIEPVAEVWGTLDADIDERLDSPVTSANLEGFHKLEMLLWSNDTLTGAAAYCSQLVQHEQQLAQLVTTASYDPVTMASGATDLINEAATSKITGEEERYSNTDFIVFQANVDGAMEVVNLLKPYLQKNSPQTLSKIQRQYQRVESAIAKYKATPGLRQHRLRRVLDRARSPAPPAVDHGAGLRRVAVQDVGASRLSRDLGAARGMSRRQLLGRLGVAGAGLALGSGAVLEACAGRCGG